LETYTKKILIKDKEFCHLGHNALKSTETSFACYLPHAGLLLGLFFDPEDEGDIFVRNVG
jgi:hypothetical protein